MLPSALIEIGVCVLVGLSVGLVCVHARPLLVLPVHTMKLFNEKVNSTEFVINASISDTTRYTLFELNNSYMPSMLREIRRGDTIAPGIRRFAETALCNLADAHNVIIESHVFQTYHANKKRRDEPVIAMGDLVYLLTKNLNLSKGRVHKLCPKFVGPYRVTEAFLETLNYVIELSVTLQARRIHPRFHVSLLWPYHPNNNALFPNRAQPKPYNFGAPDSTEWFVDEIVAH